MPAFNTISADKLARLIGLPGAPTIIDVRSDEAFAEDPRLIPGSIRRSHGDVAFWGRELDCHSAVVTCQKGMELAHGVAALLRNQGIRAEALEAGAKGWAAAGMPMVPEAKLPPRDPQGRTTWVTRSRPKVDRIACPWLIRRYVDPD